MGNDREHSQFGIPGTSFAGEGDAGKSRTRRYAVSNDSGKQQQRNSNGFRTAKKLPSFSYGHQSLSGPAADDAARSPRYPPNPSGGRRKGAKFERASARSIAHPLAICWHSPSVSLTASLCRSHPRRSNSTR